MELLSMIESAPRRRDEKCIFQLYEAGFDALAFDLSLYCTGYELEHREALYEKRKSAGDVMLSNAPERLPEYAEKLRRQYRTLGIRTPLGIAPGLLPGTERSDSAALLRELAGHALSACAEAGCRAMLLDPPLRRGEAEAEEANRAFYLSLADKAREKQVTLLIRNGCQLHHGRFVRGTFAEEGALARRVDELNNAAGEERFALCVDVGVCNLLGQDVRRVLCRLGRRVKAVVLRENDGERDDALLPFGTAHGGRSCMDWMGIIRGLREIDFDGMLVMDFRDSAMAVSHLLRTEVDRLGRKLADYLVWQIALERTIRKYPSRVLFGAGNMCRNYMKNYGREYPPLFTCDNNAALWGTTFEGLEIRSPEALRALPADCAVFICNVYYDEIASQLNAMRLKNPIERFCDEYMPSFYFERFDGEKRELER